MKGKLMMLLACLFMSASMVTAQVSKVTGLVLGAEDNEPVIGATIAVKGVPTLGAITDIDGKFVIENLPSTAKTLVVSYVGMTTQEVTIHPYVKVMMQSDDEVLEEVVIAVPYGTVKKANFSGSAAQVDGEKLQKMQVANITNALQGAVAGVQTTSASGRPGATSAIMVRGIGSVNTEYAEPLIVVDGVAFEGSLNSIPTQDIESMTILKDAAANSMYGARGANGVVMITTKSGGNRRPRVNFEARYGINERGVSAYDLVTNPGEYYEMIHEAATNNLAGSMGYLAASQYVTNNFEYYTRYNVYRGIGFNDIIDPATGKLSAAAQAASLLWNENWLDGISKGVHQEYNVNVSGGNDRTSAYLSAGYLGDEGIVPGSGFDRVSLRTKVDQKITDRIKTGLSLAYSRTDTEVFGSESSNYSNIFLSSQSISPLCPIYLYDNEGNPVMNEKTGKQMYDYGTEHSRIYSSQSNPFANAQDCINDDILDNVNARVYFNWEIIKNLTFSANVAYDIFNDNSIEFMTPVAGDAASVGGRGTKVSLRKDAMNVNQLLTYAPSFGKNNINVLLGHETNEMNYSYFAGEMTGYVDATNPEFANAVVYNNMTSYKYARIREGYFSKADYNYDDRYYVTGSYRRDGSSVFHPDVRWGAFWAVGGSWRFSKENFMRGASWLDDAKLKASYGIQGNDNVGLYNAYSDLYRIDRVDGEAALTKTQRGNKDLTWEKSKNFNAGIEGRLWNRVNFDVNYFMKETTDMLFYSPLPSSQGSPSGIYKNEMDMKNVGFDFELSADLVRTDDVLVTLGVNGMHYKNMLTKLPASKSTADYPDGYQSGSYWREIGGSLFQWNLFEYVGVDEKTGLPQYNDYYDEVVKDEEGNVVKDADGNPVTVEKVKIVNTTDGLNAQDYRHNGRTSIPDFTGGVSLSASAYGFDLSVQTAFQIGGYVYDSFYAGLMNSGSITQGFHKDMLNRWSTPGQVTNVPKLCLDGSTGIYSSGSSDRWLTSASYFALRNVSFGYTLPKNLTKKASIENCRVYVTGDNLWLKSARKGLDPRQDVGGGTGYGYSAMRTYSLGLSLTF